MQKIELELRFDVDDQRPRLPRRNVSVGVPVRHRPPDPDGQRLFTAAELFGGLMTVAFSQGFERERAALDAINTRLAMAEAAKPPKRHPGRRAARRRRRRRR